MVWRIDDPQGGEAQKVKYDVVRYTRGVGLDLGCGPTKAFPHFIGVDSCKDTALFGIQMKPDVVCKDASNLDDCIEDASCDFIFSSHLLEHIDDYQAALRNWWAKIKAGGHLCLYLPHRDLYPNVGQHGANPDHKHDFVPYNIHAAMDRFATDVDVVCQEIRNGGQEYSFLLVYRKQLADERDECRDLTAGGQPGWRWPAFGPGPAKTACVVRYGGIGDMMQAANLLPELKRQGYHVTFMTTPRGQEPLLHDPHIDDWFIQDNDQVPNQELAEFWRVQARHFDRFINLSESIEGTLLAMPGRSNHMWPDSVRRRRMGINYLEWTAELAELPYAQEARFYATAEETQRAVGRIDQLRTRMDGALSIPQARPHRMFVMWCLSGSSVHKFYPGQDDVIANLLAACPEVVVLLVGDAACKILEAGWEQEERVVCLSGELAVRDTLALAQQVDIVVGPETGVLNAVAFDAVPKVVLMSHSSVENLTRDWLNVDAMEPQDTSCYPCHRLHYGRDFCHEDPITGAAMCQVNISPKRVFEVILERVDLWRSFKGLIYDAQRPHQAGAHALR